MALCSLPSSGRPEEKKRSRVNTTEDKEAKKHKCAGQIIFNVFFTCADEKHVVSPLHALDLVHGDLRVAHAALQQQGGAADHAVHQEMVLDKVEHFVGHVQGRLDPHLPGVVGHALRRWTAETTGYYAIINFKNTLNCKDSVRM